MIKKKKIFRRQEVENNCFIKKKTQAKTQEKFGKTPNEEQLPVMDANEHSRICSTLTILHAPMGFKQKRKHIEKDNVANIKSLQRNKK